MKWLPLVKWSTYSNHLLKRRDPLTLESNDEENDSNNTFPFKEIQAQENKLELPILHDTHDIKQAILNKSSPQARCNKALKKQKKPKRRLRPHKHACEQCGQLFKIKAQLEEHVKIVHEGIRITCNQCSKQYTKQSELNAYQKQFLRLPRV